MDIDNEFEEQPEGEPFQPELVRPPANGAEWYDCVVTEFIWLTGRPLPMTTPVNVVLHSLLNRGIAPLQAANYLIEKLELAI